MSKTLNPFSSVYAEGGLITLEFLLRVSASDKEIPGLKPNDYHLQEGETLGEVISRAWSTLCSNWASFREALKNLPEDDLGTSITRSKWLLPLFKELDYGRLPASASATEVGEKSFMISHFYGRLPVQMLGARISLEERTKGEKGAATATPHGLLQDFLNSSPQHLWGIVTNGKVLRILRDHQSLTRQAYIEFDLEAIFEGQLYTQFALLWMFLHQSRVEEQRPEDFWWERWFKLSQDEGVRALDQLRRGVEDAISALGTGFVRNKKNSTLFALLKEGRLDKQELYRQLLRMVYRIIFVLAAEERRTEEGKSVLLDPKCSDAAFEIYERYYSLHSVRDLAQKRRGSAQPDVFEKVKLLFRKLDEGEPALGLPALGSFLFSKDATPHLDMSFCDNEHFLNAMRALCFVQKNKQTFPVSWRGIGADELGSVYEGLLELHPQLNLDAGTFALQTAAGHERKTTGSYYTPTSLVDCLLDSTLNPVLEEAISGPSSPSVSPAKAGGQNSNTTASTKTNRTKAEIEKSILALTVCDPACGSGHFLVAAARRIARRLAQIRSGDEEPSPRELRHALRDVVSHCIYGVDMNPMAVELCKVALWMEAIEPGKPLSFLDAHIQCGNSLLGATPALLEKGIPDEALDPIEGDDKKIASAAKKRNKKEREGQGDLFGRGSTTWNSENLTKEVLQFESSGQDSKQEIRAKQERYEKLLKSSEYENAKLRADAWCAAFVWPKVAGGVEPLTEKDFRAIEKSPSAVNKALRDEVQRIAKEYQFFHWHLAFPAVFRPASPSVIPAKAGIQNSDATPTSVVENKDNPSGWEGGFSVVLGNPPWERVKLQEQEFFAGVSEEIEKAPNSAARKKLIAALPKTNPTLWKSWQEALRVSDGQSKLIRETGRFPLCGRGDINTYAIFSELNRNLIGSTGRAGFIVPTGIATDDTTKFFFQALVDSGSLVSLFDFQSGPGLFGEIGHARFKFCLLTLGGNQPGRLVDLIFFVRDFADFNDPQRRFTLSPEDFAKLNPNTKTCPTFRWKRDAEINKAIYRRVHVLHNEEAQDGDPWGVRFMAMFHMSNDSHLFRTKPQLEAEGWQPASNIFEKEKERCLPLLEAKMLHHFDHRYGDYRDQPKDSENTSLPDVPIERLQNPSYGPLPRYWVAEKEVEAKLNARWTLGWRDITNATNERTVIAAIIPRVGVGHKFPLFVPESMAGPLASALSANLASFVFDYCARQKVGGTSLTYFILKQLPLLAPDDYNQVCRWSLGENLQSWILPRVLELTYTAWDLELFANGCGYDGPPYKWNTERRFWLRAELDAAFFHLYGVQRDEVDYIMETFPIAKRNDEREHGSYRTKEAILAIFDEMANATQSGTSLSTRLNPPPGDPSVAHPIKKN